MSDAEVVRKVVAQTDFVMAYNDGTILCKFVRLCYPHVFTPYKDKDDPDDKKPSFSCIGLWPKSPNFYPSKDIVRNRINEIATQNKNPQLPADRKFLRDGSLKTDKPEYIGNFTISANEERRPLVLGPRNDPKTGKPQRLDKDKPDDVALIYGGCYGNMLIRPWWQSNKWGKRVNAGLVAVQYVPLSVVHRYIPDAIDEPFGTGRISEDAVDETFASVTDADDGYDDGLGSGGSGASYDKELEELGL